MLLCPSVHLIVMPGFDKEDGGGTRSGAVGSRNIRREMAMQELRNVDSLIAYLAFRMPRLLHCSDTETTTTPQV